jgi:hypothetical protein
MVRCGSGNGTGVLAEKFEVPETYLGHKTLPLRRAVKRAKRPKTFIIGWISYGFLQAKPMTRWLRGSFGT